MHGFCVHRRNSILAWHAGVNVIHFHCGQVPGRQPLHQHGPWADHDRHPHSAGLPGGPAVCLHARAGPQVQQEGRSRQHAGHAPPPQVSPTPYLVAFLLLSFLCVQYVLQSSKCQAQILLGSRMSHHLQCMLQLSKCQAHISKGSCLTRSFVGI